MLAGRRRPITGSPQSRSVSRRGEGLPGYGAILFVRALVVHPAGYAPLLAHSRRSHCCLRSISALSASRKHIGFGAAVPRPARSRAYASPLASLPPSQGWLPAGRAHPWPGGFRTRWMTDNISWRHDCLQSQLTHRAGSHWNSYPLAPYDSYSSLRPNYNETVDKSYKRTFFAPRRRWVHR